MKTIKQIAKALSALAVGAYMTLMPAKAEAEFFSAEVLAGQESATLDTMIFGEIGDAAGVGGRIRATVDYEGNASTFGMIDFTYELYEGFGAIFEAHLSDGGISFRPGLQYVNSWGDFSIYALSTVGVDTAPDVDVIAILRYQPDLTDRLSFVSQAECVSNFGGEGHNFSIQRLRLGLGVDWFEFGAAGDLREDGNSGDFSYNVGGYVRVRR
ncbi:hypothetical protein KY362_01605 [Candidatus Woesearchaeota archaeon]|nr:hypothetical protein [Candidatus Woesearchaeota archaeon]